MNLSNARELKSNLMALTRQRALERLLRAPHRAGRAGFTPRSTAETELSGSPVAFGVSPGKHGSGYRLAVRISNPGSTIAREALQSINTLPENELDVVSGVTYAPRYALRPGGSCGHYQVTAGTLGCFVQDAEGIYMLSNNHVLANSNNATAGDAIWQPGPSDVQGGKFKIIGHLHRWISLSPLGTDNLDAALARPSGAISRILPRHYSGIGISSNSAIPDRYAVDRVIKRGRTTGVTRGKVSAFELDGIRINYGTRRNPFVVSYDNQIELTHVRLSIPFSQPGDSGSFILDRDTLQPYALLYGGGLDSNGVDRTLAHFMPDVLARFNVTLTP